MKFITILFLFSCCSFFALNPITLHNESDLTIFAAPYYSYKDKAKQASAVKELKAHTTAPFERPSIKLLDLGTREIIAALQREKLTTEISAAMLMRFPRENIANPLYNDFYLISLGGETKIFNHINWKIVQPIINKLKSATAVVVAATVDQLRKLWQPAHATPTKVRQAGKGLCDEEKKYISERRKKINTALKKIGISVDAGQEPVIALCGSGGGVRSTVAYNGIKNGLAKIGLLDAIMYEATLSGSTWEAAPSAHMQLSPAQFKQFLKERLPSGILNKRFSLIELSSNLFRKVVFAKPISLVDLYGAMLGSMFLKEPQQELYKATLSQQAKSLHTGNRPMPIYTAITSAQPYVWLSFTPYEIGSDELGAFIAPSSLGRQFVKGTSVNYAPEESLCYLMGTFGYAIGVNLKEVMRIMGNKIESKFIHDLLHKTSQETVIGNIRLLPGEYNNFTYQMPGTNKSYNNKRQITLLDAGIHYNLPIPPLLRKERAVDIIIVIDNSAGTTGDELRKTEQYFKQKGLSFPTIDYTRVHNTITVFEDAEHPATPIIVYMPLVKNNKYSENFDPKNCPDDACSTFNFTYKTEIIEELSGLTEFTIIENKEYITKLIRDRIKKKSQSPSNQLVKIG